MESYHRIVIPHNRGVEVGGGGPETYVVSFPQALKSVACPVDGCPERAHNPVRLRENFMYWHWKAKISILQEGLAPLPQCDQYGMHMPVSRMWIHKRTDRRERVTDMSLRRIYMEMEESLEEMEFILYGREGDTMMEGVTQFKYLGRPLDKTHDDQPEVWRNTKWARKVWGILGKIL